MWLTDMAQLLGDRAYYLDLSRILRLFTISSLHSLRILTGVDLHTYQPALSEDGIEQLSRATNITELVFDESVAKPDYIISMLRIPRSLRRLRWRQNFSCLSINSCTRPFYDTLGESLLRHKDSLEHLDLDLRHAPCEAKGQAGNPHARLEDMTFWDWDAWRSSCHLLGSLQDFSYLKSLRIPPDALCGNKVRGVAPARLADSLPPSLEELTLPFHFSVLQEKRTLQLGEQIWINELVNLVNNARRVCPNLTKITVLDWNPTNDWPRKEDEGMFLDVQVACAEVGIEFMMRRETSPWQTTEPYFLEILPTRNPGRDY